MVVVLRRWAGSCRQRRRCCRYAHGPAPGVSAASGYLPSRGPSHPATSLAHHASLGHHDSTDERLLDGIPWSSRSCVDRRPLGLPSAPGGRSGSLDSAGARGAGGRTTGPRRARRGGPAGPQRCAPARRRAGDREDSPARLRREPGRKGCTSSVSPVRRPSATCRSVRSRSLMRRRDSRPGRPATPAGRCAADRVGPRHRTAAGPVRGGRGHARGDDPPRRAPADRPPARRRAPPRPSLCGSPGVRRPPTRSRPDPRGGRSSARASRALCGPPTSRSWRSPGWARRAPPTCCGRPTPPLVPPTGWRGSIGRPAETRWPSSSSPGRPPSRRPGRRGRTPVAPLSRCRRRSREGFVRRARAVGVGADHPARVGRGGGRGTCAWSSAGRWSSTSIPVTLPLTESAGLVRTHGRPGRPSHTRWSVRRGTPA